MGSSSFLTSTLFSRMIFLTCSLRLRKPVPNVQPSHAFDLHMQIPDDLFPLHARLPSSSFFQLFCLLILYHVAAFVHKLE